MESISHSHPTHHGGSYQKLSWVFTFFIMIIAISALTMGLFAYADLDVIDHKMNILDERIQRVQEQPKLVQYDLELSDLEKRIESLEQQAVKKLSAKSHIDMPVGEKLGDLQFHLARLGYDVGSIDCRIGPKTQAAWKKFLQRLGGEEKNPEARLAELSKLSGHDMKRQKCTNTPPSIKNKSHDQLWQMRAAMPGKAWLVNAQDELLAVKVGEQLAGLGTVENIFQNDQGRWMLIAKNGFLKL